MWLKSQHDCQAGSICTYVRSYSQMQQNTLHTIPVCTSHWYAVSFKKALSVCNQWALTTISTSALCGHNDSKGVITLYKCFQGDGDGFHPWTFSHIIGGMLEHHRDCRLQIKWEIYCHNYIICIYKHVIRLFRLAKEATSNGTVIKHFTVVSKVWLIHST